MQLILTLDNAIHVIMDRMQLADEEMRELIYQELEQVCYLSDDQYEIGYADALAAIQEFAKRKRKRQIDDQGGNGIERNLNEMDKLEAYLKENYIAYKRIDKEGTYPEEYRNEFKTQLKKYCVYDYEPFDQHQIIVYDKDGRRRWDVICQKGSYGAERGLLEGMGDIFDEAEGHLTAAEIIQRIEIQTRRI